MRTPYCVILGLVFVTMPSMAWSQAVTTDTSEIEAALAADSVDAGGSAKPSGFVAGAKRVWQKMNPDISLLLDVAGAYFNVDDPAMTGAHDPAGNGFHIQQLELTLGQAVDAYFRMDANLVFSLEGVEVEEAYVTTTSIPGGLQLRAGQFLSRFGRVNTQHPHSWSTVDQNFAVGRYLGGEGGRAPGLEASWLAPTPWFLEVIAAVTTPRNAETGRTFYTGELPDEHGDEDHAEEPADAEAEAESHDGHVHGSAPAFDWSRSLVYTAALRQFFDLTDTWSVLWGLSAAWGWNTSDHDQRSSLYGTDLYLKYRVGGNKWQQWILQSELFWHRRHVPAGLQQDYSLYALSEWRAGKHWGLGARYEYGSPTVNGGGTTVASDLDPDWVDGRHRYAAVLTTWPTEFSRLRLQANLDDRIWQPDLEWGLMLQGEFTIGVHGAHTY